MVAIAIAMRIVYSTFHAELGFILIDTRLKAITRYILVFIK